eukprot:TRINITY_DN3346_c0_g1_i2.p1 TRINITY_DN3346_c0_g1~~TRINITY_DN3346_c0_g1_i2.p1  ORF type:complete len:485 (+),score=49.21 TRINITY_DN3346_c0_g1_i2:46-1500(+)
MFTRILCGWVPVLMSLCLSLWLFSIVATEAPTQIDRLPNLHHSRDTAAADETAVRILKLRQGKIDRHFQKLRKWDIDPNYHFNGECKWIQTTGCSPYGELEPSENKGCQDPVSEQASGICQCPDERLFGKSCTSGNGFFFCSEACGISEMPPLVNYSQSLRFQDSSSGAGLPAYFVTFSPTKKYTRVIRMLKSLRYATSQWSRLYPLAVIHDPEDGFSSAYKASIEKALASPRRFVVHYIKASPEYYNIPKGVVVSQIPLFRHKRIRNMDSLQYRQIARYLSGFVHREHLFRHTSYLIIIPDEMIFICKVPYDIPLFMHLNNKTIGYTMMYHEHMEAMPSLGAAMESALNSVNASGKKEPRNKYYGLFMSGKSYSGCGFGSSLIAVKTSYMGSASYSRVFASIDSTGGFFYERWAHHSVSTLLAASILPPSSWCYLEAVGISTPHNGHHVPHDPFTCIGEPIPNRVSEAANDWRHPCIQMLTEG